MLTVELLPASYGDAILVSYGSEDKPHRLLIDGGLSSTFPAVAKRLNSFEGRVDLLVVTHVDTDHIRGVVKLLNDDELAARIDGIWFNGFVHLERFKDLLGPIDGERLTARIVALGLPWNEGWPDPVQEGVGGPVVVTGKPPVMKLAGGATATVLSPTPEKLARLLSVWREVVEAAGLRPRVKGTEEAPVELVAADMLGGLTLADVAGFDTDDDGAEANGSSIAFVFEFEGKRVLFGADAHADALLGSLAQLAGADGKVRVDACKLPHHGSRANVTRKLIAALDCPLWLVSTNGKRFRHPDDEALARVVSGAPEGTVPRLVFNYRSERFLAFTEAFPPDRSAYAVDVPDKGAEGITVRLAD